REAVASGDRRDVAAGVGVGAARDRTVLCHDAQVLAERTAPGQRELECRCLKAVEHVGIEPGTGTVDLRELVEHLLRRIGGARRTGVALVPFAARVALWSCGAGGALVPCGAGGALVPCGAGGAVGP